MPQRRDAILVQPVCKGRRFMPVLPFVNTRQRQFEALVRAHSGELYRYAYWLCGQAALAEDLVQETLLRAWKGLEALREADAARGWLYTILRREHARLYERVRPGIDELDDEQHAAEMAWSDPERQGSDAELRAAMLALPPKHRVWLQLRGNRRRARHQVQCGDGAAVSRPPETEGGA